MSMVRRVSGSQRKRLAADLVVSLAACWWHAEGLNAEVVLARQTALRTIAAILLNSKEWCCRTGLTLSFPMLWSDDKAE